MTPFTFFSFDGVHFSLYIVVNFGFLCMCVYTWACTCLSSCTFLSCLVLTVRYEQDRYTVSEETGYVTLALVLEGDAPIPVTVSVNTLNLLNSSVGDAATGELLKFPCC